MYVGGQNDLDSLISKVVSLFNHHAMKIYGGVEDVMLHTFLTLLPGGGESSAYCSSCLTAKKRALGIQWTEGRLGSRSGLNFVKRKLSTSYRN
jgi:hypothetical protein